jgi:ribosomal-protein-alanine N-acetyltransferase
VNAHIKSVQPLEFARFEPMKQTDLNEVVSIETTLYSAPWTLGNFRDSLAANYSSWVLRAPVNVNGHPALLGYFLLMAAVDDAHLLNLSVARPYQHQGLGLALLHKVVEVARSHRAANLILEVRPSNVRALSVYQRYGFHQIGLRAGYYPTNEGQGGGREDALVMSFPLN